ncbi:MAG: hypothetical protein ACK5N0_03775 [Synechococcaceae cyanobacterium]
MTDTITEGWTQSELALAREVFDRAYERAIDRLVLAVRSRSAALTSADAVWALHDFLSIQRHSMEGRFHFQVEGILFVFAGLVKEDLLRLEELAGLERDKLAKIAAMARF